MEARTTVRRALGAYCTSVARWQSSDLCASAASLQSPEPPAGSRLRPARCGRGLGTWGIWEHAKILSQSFGKIGMRGADWAGDGRVEIDLEPPKQKHSTRVLFDPLPDRRGRTPEDCVYMTRKPRTWRQYRLSACLRHSIRRPLRGSDLLDAEQRG
jgi:hypothetical protein